MKSMSNTTPEIKSQALFDEFARILAFLREAFEQGGTAQAVETGLWQRMLQLGRSLFGGWLVLFGDGDAGERVVLDDGREVRRLDTVHRREIRNVFGLFELMWAVYGTWEGQKIEAVPLDKRLRLPKGMSSYLLQDWDRGLAVEMPYEQVSTGLERILGFTQSVHTLERNQREMAKPTARGYRCVVVAKPPPHPSRPSPATNTCARRSSAMSRGRPSRRHK